MRLLKYSLVFIIIGKFMLSSCRYGDSSNTITQNDSAFYLCDLRLFIDREYIKQASNYHSKLLGNLSADFRCDSCFFKCDNIKYIAFKDSFDRSFVIYELLYKDSNKISIIKQSPDFSYSRMSNTEAPEYFHLIISENKTIYFIFYYDEKVSSEAKCLLNQIVSHRNKYDLY